MSKYNFSVAEKKWRKKWKETPIQQNTDDKPKYYCLDMFPYPSGNGLHVGHWRGYTFSDVLTRYKILQGYHVLHPMGWDAFGLPAENTAIKKKVHPSISTDENIVKFKRQLDEMGTDYDWNYELSTTDPKFFKWTQWIFARMFEKGLAYEKEMPLNWCDSCKAVLANEEAKGGICERCKGATTKKNLRQWMIKITDYAERLLNDLDDLKWPERVKKMQAEWIGKSNGAEIDFVVADSSAKIKAFTTRPDTLFGATFIVLAPEHELVSAITTPEQKNEVNAYVKKATTLSSVDRMAAKEKTGVFTGRYAVNPMTGKANMPIWVADYVLIDYGTGAIMCVPGHDERDFEFAEKFELPIVEVISKEGKISNSRLEAAYTGDGRLVNSDKFSGLTVDEAKDAITEELDKMSNGKRTVNYKLRDWVFSRQRYWGEPIPLIHCQTCDTVVVPDEDLPVLLPELEFYEPTSTGESPLALVDDWVNVSCPKCNKPAKRETNTMPQWAGSSWYFLRYPDISNEKELVSKEVLKKWLPVDYYVGGIEHAVLHLLYARFYTKFLFDIGVVDFEEPFEVLFNIGMVNKDGKKIAKSGPNAISPDDLIIKYGTDAMRLYELFIGPPEVDCEWDDKGIEGTFRFINKVWRIATENNFVKETEEMERLRHRLVSDITYRINTFSYNTIISGFMEHTNTMQDLAKKSSGISKELVETLTILLAPFAPHLAEEIWELVGYENSVFLASWPTFDESKLKADTIKIAVQLGGKLRGTVEIPADVDKDAALLLAKEFLGDKLDGLSIVKEIYVPGKIANFVVK